MKLVTNDDGALVYECTATQGKDQWTVYARSRYRALAWIKAHWNIIVFRFGLAHQDLTSSTRSDTRCECGRVIHYSRIDHKWFAALWWN